MDIWVFYQEWEDNHGVTLYFTEDQARQALSAYVKESWENLWPEEDSSAFEDLVEEYFSRQVDNEWYNIYKFEIKGDPPATLPEFTVSPLEQELLMYLLKKTSPRTSAFFQEGKGMNSETFRVMVRNIYDKLRD